MSFFIPLDPFPPEPKPQTTQVPGDARRSNLVAQGVIDIPRTGKVVRELVTWRTPHRGYVQMYINPQQMSVDNSKDITAVRTKGGFVIQYAGENLTTISLSGTTGSAGIEGINVLESVYRSEQEAFEGVARALEERLSVIQMGTITGLTSFLDPNLLQIASESVQNFGRPQPTLASLAANIEMFFQGVLYRGYFEKFTVTEAAPESGHFRYDLTFIAYAKQGVRRNFMPWHRQPVHPANTHDSGVNPLSFPDINGAPPELENQPSFKSSLITAIEKRDKRLRLNQNGRARQTSSAADSQGRNIDGTDLRR